MDLLRAMSNTNPIDRPSIEFVMNELEKQMNQLLTPMDAIKMKLEDVRRKMKDEIDDEIAANDDRVRVEARDKALKKLEVQNDAWAERDKEYKKNLVENQNLQLEFYKYIGMWENCKITDMQELQNTLDPFGYIPNFITLNGENNAEHDINVNQEAHKKEHGSKAVHDHHKEEVISKHKGHEAEEHHEELGEMRVEFILLISFLLFLAMVVSSYFVFKNLDIKMYNVEDFKYYLDLEE